MADYNAWYGDAISIKQNGNVIGSMEPKTKDFQLCLDYDDVDIDNDIFEFASTTTNGVCITSLSVDGTDILVGPNGKQPSFWIDGDFSRCTDNFVSTKELQIQNKGVLSSQCDKFCIQMTSSPDPYLCEHPKADYNAWSGGAISIKQNGNVIGSMEPGTKDFQLCLDNEDVDIETDIFEFARTTTDSVCITSLSIDGTISLLVQIEVSLTSGLMVTTTCVQMTSFPLKNSLLEIIGLYSLNAHQKLSTDDFGSSEELIIQKNSVYVIFSQYS